ncbi:MAG: DUF177 domain-containing protein [bacterium]
MVSGSRRQLQMDVRELPEGKLEIELECSQDSLGLTEKALCMDGTVFVKLLIFKASDRVDISGSVSFACLLDCSRCLKRYRLSGEEGIVLYCRKARELSASREIELSKEDVMTYFYEDNIIDLTSSVRDAILLSIPMKPLCSAECKGFCPICGRDLNRGKCLCAREMVHARWDALKKLKR